MFSHGWSWCARIAQFAALCVGAFIAQHVISKHLQSVQFYSQPNRHDEPGIPTSIYVPLGNLESDFIVRQTGFPDEPSPQFPHGTYLTQEFLHPSTGLIVELQWHPCNPSQWGSVEPFDQTGGGTGGLDTSTSGGEILIYRESHEQPHGTMAAELSGDKKKRSLQGHLTWSLAGTSQGFCCVYLEPLATDDGQAVRDMQTLLVDLEPWIDGAPEAEGRWKTLKPNLVAFVDNAGNRLGAGFD